MIYVYPILNSLDFDEETLEATCSRLLKRPSLPSHLNETEVERKERELEGQSKGRDEDVFNLLECHVHLDLEGFEDIDPRDGEPSGIKLPYVVTVERTSNKVLSIFLLFLIKITLLSDQNC